MKITSQKQPKLILLIVILFWFAQYVYIPYQTPYLAAINVSTNFVGMIVGAYGISQLLLRLPVGVMADLRGNHKFFITIGVLLAGFASLIRIISPDGVGFLVANILSGFASATWISFMVLYLSYFSKLQQTSATSKIIMANNLGMLLGFITSTLLFNMLGMQIICLFSLLAGLIGFGFSLFIINQKSQPSAIKLRELLQIGKNRRLLLFSLLALIQQGIQMSTTMSFTNQIIQTLSGSSLLVGISSIIYMVAAVFFARLASTDFINRLPKKNWIILSFILLAVYCVAVPLSPSVGLIYVLQLIPGMATGILFSLLTSEAMMEVPAEKKSTAMGFFQAIYAIGMTLFPIIAGTLNDSFSMTTAYFFLGFMALLAGSSFYVYGKVGEKLGWESY
ncbi:MFS transporter [Enterococcus sp. HY326]|uniref:MFS transporter n=1 Tax=Enterococcus sp. HY326 TaxID=2971265 RepID=UPI002240C80B|nr:MFS transporter [Enterococcus sp. HY326]